MPQALALFLFQIGAPLALATFFTTAAGAFVLTTALSIGLSLISGALLRNQSSVPKPSDGQQALRQALASRTKTYGHGRKSGAVWWYDAVAAHMFVGIAINHGRIGRITSYHIDDNEVDVDGTDTVTTTPYVAKIYHHLGTTPETDYAALGTTFGATHMRGDGVASILADLTNPATGQLFQEQYPIGVPNLRVTADFSVVWDPRDTAQVRTDPTTWTFSDNPIVCALDYWMSADGMGVAWARIEPNLAQWIACMNTCDEAVRLASGQTHKRYRLFGTYRLVDDDPVSVIKKFESVCDGRFWAKRDGTIGVTVGQFPPEASIKMIEAKSVLGFDKLQFGQDENKRVEGVTAQYVSPDHDYREHDAEPWPNAETLIGLSDDRSLSLDLLWVPSGAQARRLMKRAYIQSRTPIHGTIQTDAAGLQLIDERFFRLVLPELDINQTFEILHMSIDVSGPIGCEFEIRAIDRSIDDWDAATEEGEATSGFAYVSSFTKEGTTINPLTEVGAAVGQLVVIFMTSGGTQVAVPTGWSTFQHQPTALGLQFSGYFKIIDGTEGAITVSTVAGPMIALVFDGASAPYLEAEQTTPPSPGQYEVGEPSTAGPFLQLVVNASEGALVASDLFISVLATGGVLAMDGQIINNGALTGVIVAYRIYSSDETLVPTYIYNNHPGGTDAGGGWSHIRPA